MGTNTPDVLQVYAVVPPGPNQNQPSTKDATNAQVASAYEANPNTNKFTDALLTKLTNLLELDSSDDLPEGIIHFYMTAIEKSKLAGIQSGAQVNPSTTDLLTQGIVNLYMTTSEKSKLTGIQAGAQVNPTNTDSLAEGSTNKYLATENKRGLAVTTYASNVVPSPMDTQLSRRFIINMISNISSLLLADGIFDGQLLMLIIKQDATGGRTLGYDASKTQGGFDVGVPVLNGTANSRDYHFLVWNATNAKWDFMPNLRRYP
jgi:hypothetical protein